MATNTVSHCPDCGKELHEERQVWKHKPEPTITLTCTNPTCPLHGVTLTPKEWAVSDLDVYRKMNQQVRA